MYCSKGRNTNYKLLAVILDINPRLLRVNVVRVSLWELSIVLQPDSVVDQNEMTRIYSKLVDKDSKIYLYRVFVNYLKNPSIIITAYKTSKIEKYGY